MYTDRLKTLYAGYVRYNSVLMEKKNACLSKERNEKKKKEKITFSDYLFIERQSY